MTNANTNETDAAHGYTPEEGGCYCGAPGCGTADDYARDFGDLDDEAPEPWETLAAERAERDLTAYHASPEGR